MSFTGTPYIGVLEPSPSPSTAAAALGRSKAGPRAAAPGSRRRARRHSCPAPRRACPPCAGGSRRPR
eukprot:scaffold127987_cov54-Phaeocystis_antarctica.AAC.2